MFHPRRAETTDTYTCPSDATVGDLVYVSGEDEVGRANASSELTMGIIGLVATKPTATTCTVTALNSIGGYSGLIPGRAYYASAVTDGAFSSVPPTATGHIVQKIGFARSTSVLVIQIGCPFIL